MTAVYIVAVLIVVGLLWWIPDKLDTEPRLAHGIAVAASVVGGLVIIVLLLIAVGYPPPGMP